MANNRYYWLKLKEDFFQQETMEWLEEQENGKEYSLFYLKLCLKSLNNDGILIRQVGKRTIPYTAEKLAVITNTSVDIAEQAITLLQEIGLIEVGCDGELILPEVDNMVGNESATPAAERQKRYRERRNASVTECNADHNASVTQDVTERNAERNASVTPSVTQDVTERNASVTNRYVDIRDKDIRDKEKENKEKESDGDDVFTVWEKNIYPITPIVAEKIATLISEVGEKAVRYGIEAAVEQGKRTLPYVAACAKNYLADGGKTKRTPKGYSPPNDGLAEFLERSC